jgi:hypothetical protein
MTKTGRPSTAAGDRNLGQSFLRPSATGTPPVLGVKLTGPDERPGHSVGTCYL